MKVTRKTKLVFSLNSFNSQLSLNFQDSNHQRNKKITYKIHPKPEPKEIKYSIPLSKEEIFKLPVIKPAIGQINTTVYHRIPKYLKYSEKFLKNDGQEELRKKYPTETVFTTTKSNSLVKESILHNYDASYYKITEQLITQNFPTYCGIANLIMILNALGIDPKRRWKGIWRWYDEDVLHCVHHETIKNHGINLDELNQIARCNGLYSMYFRPDENEEKTNEILTEIIKNGITNNSEIKKEDLYNTEYFLNKEISSGVTHSKNNYYCQRYNTSLESSNENKENKENEEKKEKYSYKSNEYKQANKLLFELCCETSSKRENLYCLVSHSRKYLKQTGNGHFSIVTLMHPIKKLILFLEVARFKYKSIWLTTDNAYDSLFMKDSTSKLPRGFMMVGKYF